MTLFLFILFFVVYKIMILIILCAPFSKEPPTDDLSLAIHCCTISTSIKGSVSQLFTFFNKAF